jgi:hypothetical protein
MTNCIISGNNGNGIYRASSSPTIINSTISGNSTEFNGGGIFCYGYSFPTFINSILWGNIARIAGNEIYLARHSSIDITYSDIQGGYNGIGNIDVDPLFVDPNNGDYHIKFRSPCIDAGTTSGAPEHDIDDDPRLSSVGGDNMPDIGADEYNGEIINCDPEAEWKNHGQYVKCVTHEVKRLISEGVITKKEGSSIISDVAQSGVGRK